MKELESENRCTINGTLLSCWSSRYIFLAFSMQMLERSVPPLTTSSNDSKVEKEELDKIKQAYELISSKYYKDVDDKKLLDGAIQGMVQTLGDPHSSYMDKKTAQQFTQSLDSSFEGIGAEVSMVDGKVTIVAPFKQSPAEKAGLKPNDQILKIDGKSIAGLELNEAVLKFAVKKALP